MGSFGGKEQEDDDDGGDATKSSANELAAGAYWLHPWFRARNFVQYGDQYLSRSVHASASVELGRLKCMCFMVSMGSVAGASDLTRLGNPVDAVVVVAVCGPDSWSGSDLGTFRGSIQPALPDEVEWNLFPKEDHAFGRPESTSSRNMVLKRIDEDNWWSWCLLWMWSDLIRPHHLLMLMRNQGEVSMHASMCQARMQVHALQWSGTCREG